VNRVKQLRDGVQQLILENPTMLTVKRYPLKDNGMGQMIPDMESVPYVFVARVRLSHESSSIARNSSTPAGSGTSLSMYVLTDFSAPLQEGDCIDALGEHWTVGPVNVMRYLMRIHSTEAPLVKVEA
jgi:hypothetical protein